MRRRRPSLAVPLTQKEAVPKTDSNKGSQSFQGSPSGSDGEAADADQEIQARLPSVFGLAARAKSVIDVGYFTAKVQREAKAHSKL